MGTRQRCGSINRRHSSVIARTKGGTSKGPAGPGTTRVDRARGETIPVALQYLSLQASVPLMTRGDDVGGRRVSTAATPPAPGRRAPFSSVTTASATPGGQVLGDLNASGKGASVTERDLRPGRESRERSRFGDGDVTQRRPGGGHPTGGGVTESRRLPPFGCLVGADGSADVDHPHECRRVLPGMRVPTEAGGATSGCTSLVAGRTADTTLKEAMASPAGAGGSPARTDADSATRSRKSNGDGLAGKTPGTGLPNPLTSQIAHFGG